MTLSDYLIFIAIVVVAWSQYRCYLFQEELSQCSEREKSKAKTEPCSDTRKSSSVDESNVKPRLTDRTILEGGSSVYCSGSSNTDRMCRFYNLCFSQKHEEFVFLNGPQSISSGLPQNPFDPTLVDLSSLPNHNMQYFGYSHLPLEVLADIKRVKVFSGRHLLMNRFNPSNIMHVFHDDLLPLFYTMLENGLMTKQDFRTNVKLVFLEGYPAGEFMDLYVSLFLEEPILKDELLVDIADDGQDGFVCFEEAHVGLSNTTTWYQYGFQNPQGPVPNTLLTANKVKLFTSFVQTQMGFKRCRALYDYAVLITRQSTRLILNEMELVLQVAQSTGMRVVTAGLEDFSMKDLMGLVSCAKVLIGMHGSLLILSMFLPLGSMLLELFPYAINPDHYTPYKTLVQLPGMGIAYKSWRNVNPDNSVAHPDALPAHGGISHLSLNEQKRLLSSIEVPRHLCCSNPDWLFRIYQDTIVDIPSLLYLLSDGLSDSEQLRTKYEDLSPIFPSKVGNINCELSEKGLHVSWQRPWNIEYMNTNEVKYELWIQEKDCDDYDAYILQLSEYRFTKGLDEFKTYRVWVRCLLGDVTGPFDGVVC